MSLVSFANNTPYLTTGATRPHVTQFLLLDPIPFLNQEYILHLAFSPPRHNSHLSLPLFGSSRFHSTLHPSSLRLLTMSFLKDLIEDFTGNQKSQNGGSQGYYPQQQQYGSAQSYNGPPPVSPPWVAEWDSRDNRWLYVNRETGERTFEHPQNRGYGAPPNQDYRGQGQGGYYQQEPPKQSHNGRNVALGAVAGLAGGALLMHEGHKVGKCTSR